MGNNSSGCCSCGSNCCTPKPGNKKITIDFLYLDLNVCERCQGADNNLDEAIDSVSGVLKAAGFDIVINKVNITTKELALRYEFLSSPTIRVNGKDIAAELIESACKDCGDLCGDNVDCRVWSYQGAEYTEPPKGMIINAILKEIYADTPSCTVKKDTYQLPHNLEVFFDGSIGKSSAKEKNVNLQF